LIFSKETGWKNPWLNYPHKGNPILVIPMDIFEAKQSLKMVVIIPVCKLDNGSWIKPKIKALELFYYARWGLLVTRKHGNNFPEVHTSTFDDWHTI
jgi:hypothetical protein